MTEDTFLDFWPVQEKNRTIVETIELPEINESLLPAETEDDDSKKEETFVFQPQKVEINETHVKISKSEIKLRVNKKRREVIEYENWLGRIVDLDDNSVGAQISNTLNRHPPRFVRIERSFFNTKGISQVLSCGDEFELSYQSVRIGKGPIHHDECIRMIQHVNLSNDEIDKYVDEQMRDLNLMFE
jgi:hypothetical protein